MPLTFLARLMAAICLSVCALSAQSQIIVSEGPLVAGEEIKVGVDDPSRANQTVTVEVDNGDPIHPTREKIEIELDASGKGVVRWECPEWPELSFTEKHSNDVRRSVLPPSSALPTFDHHNPAPSKLDELRIR